MKTRQPKANQATLFNLGEPALPLWRKSEQEDADKIDQEYQAAVQAHNQAQVVYIQARDAYRNLKIETDVYLEARRAYGEATKAFDAAYAKASGWQN